MERSNDEHDSDPKLRFKRLYHNLNKERNFGIFAFMLIDVQDIYQIRRFSEIVQPVNCGFFLEVSVSFLK